MTQLVFDPIVPIWLVWGLGALAGLGCAYGVWRGLPGAGLRALAMGALVALLLGPGLRDAQRVPLADQVLVMVDRSASNRLAGREDQISAALEALEQRAAGREVIQRVVSDSAEGTALMTSLEAALAELAPERLAGVVILSDGIAHDFDRPVTLPAQVPVHLGLSGRAQDWDRRLILEDVPAYGILDEDVNITLTLRDDGPAAPNTDTVQIEIAVDDAPPQVYDIALNTKVTLPFRLRHAGANALRLSTPVIDGELSAQNNAAVLEVTGVRDRLRVLLINGTPYAGERSWRNLLKSDPNVDLVHFTILRPPEKQDFTPANEMALIAFPTRELFLERLNEFDLIVFDRYPLRGILDVAYLENIRAYVRKGGAVLVAAGPDFAGAQSLFRSPLGDVLPASPTARVIEDGFVPTLNAVGRRHPVTRDLPGDGDWGRWMRQVDLAPRAGDVVLDGAGGAPLLILDRVEEGRVALLASDQSWLWARGFDGGGPQRELLRRLSHWAMKEPELDEEHLSGAEADGRLVVTRRSLADDLDPVVITAPDGTEQALTLSSVSPGIWQGDVAATAPGIWRLRQGEVSGFVVLGGNAGVEAQDLIASDARLSPMIRANNGSVFRLRDGVPAVRDVRAGAAASGRGWIGVVPRDAAQISGVTRVPFLPVWVWLMLAAGGMLAAWLWEGRRR